MRGGAARGGSSSAPPKSPELPGRAARGRRRARRARCSRSLGVTLARSPASRPSTRSGSIAIGAAARRHRRRPRRRDEEPPDRRVRVTRGAGRDPSTRIESGPGRASASSTCAPQHLGPDELLVAAKVDLGRERRCGARRAPSTGSRPRIRAAVPDRARRSTSSPTSTGPRGRATTRDVSDSASLASAVEAAELGAVAAAVLDVALRRAAAIIPGSTASSRSFAGTPIAIAPPAPPCRSARTRSPPTSAPDAHDRPVQHDRVRADERAVLDHAALEVREVADRRSRRRRSSGSSAVQCTTVPSWIDVRAPISDVAVVAPQHGLRPDRRLGADRHVADHRRVGMHERVGVDRGLDVAERVDRHATTVPERR